MSNTFANEMTAEEAIEKHGQPQSLLLEHEETEQLVPELFIQITGTEELPNGMVKLQLEMSDEVRNIFAGQGLLAAVLKAAEIGITDGEEIVTSPEAKVVPSHHSIDREAVKVDLLSMAQDILNAKTDEEWETVIQYCEWAVEDWKESKETSDERT